MKRGFLLVILLGIVSVNFAQEEEKNTNASIIGKIIDSSTNLPLEYATVSLFSQGEKKAINGAITDKDGNFSVTNVSAGTFSIKIEFIGYIPFTINNINIQKKRGTIDLQNILLSKKSQNLQNVTVIAGKLIENKIDKLVFNAEKDITSQTGVATDVLKKIPQVSIDVDGNVELAGSSSIRFLINGKPSTFFGSSINDVLQSIPASQIKSIEVITNPGAKYDAQGLGGIINIILKKNTAQGVAGNLSLTAGTRMENGSFNFNARKRKFGVNAFFSGNERIRANTGNSSQRLSADTALKTLVNFQQDGVSSFARHGFETGVGLDWTANKYNSLTGSFSFDNFANNGNGVINQSQVTSDQTNPLNILSAINTINNTANGFSEHSKNIGLSYKRTFDKDDQELEINFSKNFGINHRSAGNTQLLLPQDSLFYGTSSANPGKEQETELAIDYTHPLSKEVLLGVGGKLNFYNIKSTSNVMQFEPLDAKYLFDSSLSNYLNYDQKVYALYSELSFPIAHFLDAKIGGRYERTEISSFYSNAGQQSDAPGYNTFVPSIFFLRRLTDKQTLKLSYSRRIERPDYGDLNPYINTSDPKNIAAGNPYLKPETGNRYELSYNRDMDKAGSFAASIFFRENHNDIQPFIVYYPSLKIGDSIYTNVSVSTRENIGLEKNAGASLFGDIHFSDKLNIRTNLFFFYRHTINAIDKGYNSHSFNYRFNMNANYQFSKTLVAEFFGNFNSSRHEAQGRYPSFTSYNLALRKQFWNKKGSLAFTAIDPFNKYLSFKTNLFGPNFNIVSIRKVPFRSFGLNFTWKFGKLVFKNKEESNSENTNLNPPSEN